MKRRSRFVSILCVASIACAFALSACQTKAVPAAGPAPESAPAATPAAVPDGEPDAKPGPGTDEPLPVPGPETTSGPGLPAAGVPESTPLPEPSAVIPDAEGFWPAPGSRAREISISVLVGNEELIRSWKVEMISAAGAVAKVFAGDAGGLPETLTWNVIGPDGKTAREGPYTARLSADFDRGLASVSLKSRPFALCLSPPEPVLYANPSRLEPGPEGMKNPVVFEPDARPALARLESWRLDVVGPDGRILRSFGGPWPSEGSPAPVLWDCRSDTGAAVEAGKRYAAILSVGDVYGHAASAQAVVAVADLPFAPERSSVRPWTNGFSPNGDRVMDGMDFSLGFGQRAAIRSWRLEISQAGKGTVRGFHGSAPDLPESLSWDGKDSSGAPAPEGRYIATLNVDYGSAFSPAVARSPSFILDVTPPPLRLFSSPGIFSPEAPLSIRLDTDAAGDASSAPGRVTDWSVEVLDPGNGVFARFGGAWPAEVISWDGRDADGNLVESAETYRIVARARDEFGNPSQVEGQAESDILVVREGNRYRVDVASILFKGYTADFEDLPAEQVAGNRRTLDRLAAKFARFPDYRIHLVGHAVMINWDDPNLGKPEQAKILIPLSRQRAAAIARALAERGIAESRMSVEGVGASRPVVPDSDLANRWKNRRVEFYLEK